MAWRVKKGSYYYAYWREDGKVKCLRVSRDKHLTNEFLHKKELELDAKRAGLPYTTDILFPDFTDKYLEYSKTSKRPSSHRRDTISVKALTPFFEGSKLNEIRAEEIEQYKTKRKDKVTGATINRELACLRHMLNLARKWGYVLSNPVHDVKFFREPPGRIRHLTSEEESRLIESSQEPLRSIIFVALNTGMRKGEIFNITWSDVDFINRIITIQDSKTHDKRSIPMNDTILNVLTALKRKSSVEKVFPANDCKRSFLRAVKKAKLQDFTFHDLRHTFASNLLMKGASLAEIQQLLGHHDITTTMRYAHLSKQNLKNAVSLLDATSVLPDTKKLSSHKSAESPTK